MKKGTKMKQGQFSNEQIVALLQEAQKGETPIIELCKEKGVSVIGNVTRVRFAAHATSLQPKFITRPRSCL